MMLLRKRLNFLTPGEWCLVILNIAGAIVMVKMIFAGDIIRSIIFAAVYMIATLALLWSLVRQKGSGV
jgi:hypothetical protein